MGDSNLKEFGQEEAFRKVLAPKIVGKPGGVKNPPLGDSQNLLLWKNNPRHSISTGGKLPQQGGGLIMPTFFGNTGCL